MMTHPDYEILNDYADGLLDEQTVSTMHAHIAACGECAETIDQIVSLRAEARALPRILEPPAEVWENVRAGVPELRRPGLQAPERAADTVSWGAGTVRAVLWSVRYQLAAAALVLLVTASSITWYFAASRGPGVVVREVPASPATTNLVAYREVELEYGRAADELMRLLEQRRGTMDTAIVRSVEENLRVMDAAIGRARAALMSDPGNTNVAGILTATQESKLRMLRRAVSAAGGT